MSGLELNKVAAAVLVAGLIAMISGKVTDALYHPVHEVEKRGFSIAVTESADTGAAAAEAEKPESILPLLASADVAAGQEITKRCVSCHTFEKGGANKVGPNLWGVVGRDVGKHEGFTYSEAMATHGGKWDYNSLSHFLKKPKVHVPGTKMAFAGLSKENERANLIAYLRSLDDSPKPLPTAAEISAAAPAEAPVADGAAPTAADSGKSAGEVSTDTTPKPAADHAEGAKTVEEKAPEAVPSK